MMRTLLKTISTFLLCLISIANWATVFIETPIEDRLQQSTGVIKGTFLGKVYKKLPSGRVVTEATFKVSDFAGIEQNEIINHHNFKVMYPGGVWHGRVYKVHGTPSFKQGEEVVLIVKKGEFGYILPNMVFSKFNIEKEEKKIIVRTSVFPDKKGVGFLELNEFNLLVEENFGEPLHQLVVDKYVNKGKRLRKKGSRKPASKEKTNEENEEKIPVMWFVLGLGLMGFLSNHFFKGKGNES